MADTPQIILTHADTSTLNIFTFDVVINYQFPGRIVKVRTKSSGTAAAMNDGLTVDPNNGFRVVTCSALLTADEVSTLNDKMLPDTIPVYDATDPKIVLKLDGDTSFTILCVITGLKVTHKVDNIYIVRFTFTERTT